MKPIESPTTSAGASKRPWPWAAAIVFSLAACAEAPDEAPAGPPVVSQEAASEDPASEPNPLRNAYFGDLHVHTRYSFDAFLFGTVATPDEAYRFAQGESLAHPSGFEMQLPQPLDFYAVTDHAMFLGMLPAMSDPSTEISKTEFAAPFAAARTVAERTAAFRGIRDFMAPETHAEVLDRDIVRSAWGEIVASANRNYQPGRFTTFLAYEYTAAPDAQNLHRNVIFRGGNAPDMPFSRLDSQNPERLWQWMDDIRAQGFEALAIPHNSNGSNGQMFKPVTYDDAPLDATYGALRMRNEPLVEVTQVKGTSDTHPLLSPNDEWADFELMPFRIATQIISNVSGSYAREALLRGIAIEQGQGFNPFKFGLAGASDTHNASYAGDESEFYSKVGLLDSTPALRGAIAQDAQPGEGPLDVYPCPEAVPSAVAGEPSEPAPKIWCGADADRFRETYYTFWSASGLTGVWAEQNTRESIYDAFRRKETFATSGPRIRVRFFGGYGLDGVAVNAEGMVTQADAAGVPMGGDIAGHPEGAPTFLVWAARDAHSALLQRAQIIKGWTEDGAAREQVFDVACSDGLQVDPDTHRCPDNGATVNMANCATAQDQGAAELAATWQDPTFDPARRAVYYVRVLENPTCRWSTWDALRSGVAPRPDLHATIQERAWSSPIWYAPTSQDAPSVRERAVRPPPRPQRSPQWPP